MPAESSETRLVRVHASDNVAIAVGDLRANDVVHVPSHTGPSESLRVAEGVPFGHKIATRSIPPGTPVLKYGQPIGLARTAIEPGEHVHIHNVVWDDRAKVYEFAADLLSPQKQTTRTFQGFRRAHGRAGTRNYLAVISSVNCSASVSKAIAKHFDRQRLAGYPHVDGVIAFTHASGCAMQAGGLQHQILNRVLGGMARHPNIGGYLLVGLGCEKATVDYLIEDQRLVQIEGLGVRSPETTNVRPPTLIMQQQGGTAATIAAGISAVEALLPQVDAWRREPIPASELVLAMQCGGSDGNSGLTANPAVGHACDRLVDQGGTAILGETTEAVGAEHLLTRRSINEGVGRRLLERIDWWRWYANVFGETIDDNRSSGNAAGGLTTIAEKSLGAIAKGGTRPLEDVCLYAEQVRARGLVFMDSPGFDPASTTGMIAGGANLVVFTTGRGSCFACKPTPTIKVATNTPMFRRMESDMDLDAGPILTGTSVETVGDQLFEMFLRVASGEPTKSEALGLGDEEFVPWMIGPVL